MPIKSPKTGLIYPASAKAMLNQTLAPEAERARQIAKDLNLPRATLWSELDKHYPVGDGHLFRCTNDRAILVLSIPLTPFSKKLLEKVRDGIVRLKEDPQLGLVRIAAERTAPAQINLTDPNDGTKEPDPKS